MYKIKKKFPEYPFAHRQWRHDGHCKLIHGHNWTFEIELSGNELDKNGFIYDFGKFKELKKHFANLFDHTLVVNSDDPLIHEFKKWEDAGIVKLTVVESCSSEGLAEEIYKMVCLFINESNPEIDIKVESVAVYEDNKNKGVFYAN